MTKKLFVGLLGQVPEGEVVENHRLEFVVAEDVEDAKTKIISKWDDDHVHLDGIKELQEVDGYRLELKKMI